jgi:hypothetical protein
MASVNANCNKEEKITNLIMAEGIVRVLGVSTLVACVPRHRWRQLDRYRRRGDQSQGCFLAIRFVFAGREELAAAADAIED